MINPFTRRVQLFGVATGLADLFFISYCHIRHSRLFTHGVSQLYFFWRHPCLHALREFRADLVVSFSSVRGAKMILKLCGLALFG